MDPNKLLLVFYLAFRERLGPIPTQALCRCYCGHFFKVSRLIMVVVLEILNKATNRLSNSFRTTSSVSKRLRELVIVGAGDPFLFGSSVTITFAVLRHGIRSNRIVQGFGLRRIPFFVSKCKAVISTFASSVMKSVVQILDFPLWINVNSINAYKTSSCFDKFNKKKRS